MEEGSKHTQRSEDLWRLICNGTMLRGVVWIYVLCWVPGHHFPPAVQKHNVHNIPSYLVKAQLRLFDASLTHSSSWRNACPLGCPLSPPTSRASCSGWAGRPPPSENQVEESLPSWCHSRGTDDFSDPVASLTCQYWKGKNSSGCLMLVK